MHLLRTCGKNAASNNCPWQAFCSWLLIRFFPRVPQLSFGAVPHSLESPGIAQSQVIHGSCMAENSKGAMQDDARGLCGYEKSSAGTGVSDVSRLAR